ncbi:NAD(P)H-binding protein [Micromonospora craniellae]|uniref:NmrA family transcriptional regulator n=1 Tax=Micromonospora craniellae TaxID=2294034 RepID=A0A372G2V5_9ACTN|nr:NAD(P)H-binding protein [Micromonospora craniellae]QOC91218.1 NAD(P)H-binding protein [Micromonospora craniellae]RFS47342.1 NmrA family transcriptional regulator [Micromonospora craniellae]
MTIVLTTPTGNVGSHLVRLLVQAGERPRVLVRDAASLDPGVVDGVDIVEVDLTDEDGVVDATRDIAALYWVDPIVGGDDPLDGYARLTRSVTRAVRENTIDRVVFQSSVGAEKRHGVGEIDGLAVTEQALDAAGCAVAHLRCGYFFTNLLMDIDSLRGGVLTTTMSLDRPLPWVAPQDIAAVAAGRLLSRTWDGRVVQAVHGPEDLSYRDVAAVLSEAAVGMGAGTRDDFVPENPRSYATTTPTSLAAWAGQHLRPALR